VVAEQTYGGIDRTTTDWWQPPRDYTDEEAEILLRKMREALDEFMKVLAEHG
jgi:hypothetical protein